MEIYNYSPETGVFVSTGRADESPLEPGVFLIPAYATSVAPPDEKSGYVRRFDGSAWGYSPVIAPETPPTSEPVVTSEMVNAERDRRIDAGFSFKGHLFQSSATDRENIAGAYSAALTAKIAGAADDLTVWSPSTSGQPFAWIASDNSLVVMSVKDVLEFGQAALAHKQAHIMAARTVKNIDPIPLDFTDDQYWP